MAALLVVVVHITSILYGQGIMLNDALNRIGHLAVPLFLMISGALILGNEKELELKDFLNKRFKRLIPAFLFWNIFYFVFYQLFSNQYSVIERFTLFSKSLFSASHLWYLPMFIGVTLITPILALATNKIKNKEEIIWYVFVLICFDLLLRQIKGFTPDFRWSYLFNPYAFYFILGYILDKYQLKFKSPFTLFLLVMGGLCIELVAKLNFNLFNYL